MVAWSKLAAVPVLLCLVKGFEEGVVMWARTLAIFALWFAAACGGASGSGTSAPAQTALAIFEGYVTDVSSTLDGTPITDPDQLPTQVRIYTFATGVPAPIDTTTVPLTSGGSFSATAMAGDSYQLDLLDVLARTSGAAMVTATAVDGSTTYAAYLSDSASPGEEAGHVYTMVPDSNTVRVSATLSPDDANGPAIAKIRYGVVEGGFWKSDTTVPVTPDANGAVAVGLQVPLFAPGCGYVALLALDAAGNQVPSGLGGTASTPNVAYSIDQATSGGFLLFNAACSGGFDKTKWCKKKNIDKLLLKKKGSLTGNGSDDPIWCIFCPAGGAVPAGGKVVTTKKIFEAPTVSCDQHAGMAAKDGDVFIECQRFYNKESLDLQNGKKETEATRPNGPTRKSGVTYLFTAHEPAAVTGQGKSVFDYKWFQRYKSTTTYVKADGTTGTVDSTNGKYVWDDKKDSGGTTADHSYQHQTFGQSSADGTSTNRMNGLEDAPAIAIPVNAAEAKQLACDLKMPAADKDTWKSLTFHAEFQTILICCKEEPPVIMAVFEWSVSVTITRNADGTFSSSVTTDEGGPTEQVDENNDPEAPSDADWTMPTECKD